MRFGDVILAATLDSASDSVFAGAPPLAAADIAQSLRRVFGGGCAVEAVNVTGSTNEDLVARARLQQPRERLLLAADFQTDGRGRLGRGWRAAPGGALLFSVAIPVAQLPELLPAITLACGVALAECLADRGVAVQLKWPNDIRVRGCKLAGILTELVADRNARHTLVIGVGMNLHLREATRRLVEQPAIALDQLLSAEVALSREVWIGRLAGALFATAGQFVRDGFYPFRARFNRLLEARGQMVDVIDGVDSAAVSGHVVEVDARGRLVIETVDGRRAFSAGDVSVR